MGVLKNGCVTVMSLPENSGMDSQKHSAVLELKSCKSYKDSMQQTTDNDCSSCKKV